MVTPVVPRLGFRRPGSEYGAVSLAAVGLLAGAVLVAGAGGFVAQRLLSSPEEGTITGEPVDAAAVSVYPCPGDGALDDVHDGDRVFVIGVHDQQPDWLLIRNPEDTDEHWWVQRRFVATDAPVDDLPEVGCADLTGLALPKLPQRTTSSTAPPATDSPTATPTGTSEPSESAKPTEKPKPTRTTEPTKTSGPTHPPTTTPPQPDPPNVGTVKVSRSDIWERYPGGAEACGPTTSNITALASDATSVSLSWSGAANGSKAMTRTDASTWSAALGPFPIATLVEGSPPTVLVVRVTAHGPGGTDEAKTVVTLHDCIFLV